MASRGLRGLLTTAVAKQRRAALSRRPFHCQTVVRLTPCRRTRRRGPRERRGSSSRMPATAAKDNETLDHLLSVVSDLRNVGCAHRFWKVQFEAHWGLALARPRRNGLGTCGRYRNDETKVISMAVVMQRLCAPCDSSMSCVAKFAGLSGDLDRFLKRRAQRTALAAALRAGT